MSSVIAVLVLGLAGVGSGAPSELAAAYAFNASSGTSASDSSGNGITGALTNGPTWTAGRYGNALQFDGSNDHVALGNPTALRLTGSMTVSAWINSSSFPVDDAAIVSKRNASEVGYQLDTTIDRGPRTIGFKLTRGSGGQMFRYGATPMQANTWYHVTGVYNASTSELHVYLNGQLDDGPLVGSVTSSQQNSSSNVLIGQRASSGFNFAGRIDEVRIYGSALTQAEIQADMNTAISTSSGFRVPNGAPRESPSPQAAATFFQRIATSVRTSIKVLAARTVRT